MSSTLNHVDDLGDPPPGMEWRAALDLRVGDVIHRATIGGLPVEVRVESVDVKPATVYVGLVASAFGVTHRQGMRPRHDDYFPVPVSR